LFSLLLSDNTVGFLRIALLPNFVPRIEKLALSYSIPKLFNNLALKVVATKHQEGMLIVAK